ncbi:acyl-CoA N-acyltransferase [Microdochium trichocladiopsis]|uniref:histone acetyltransferase n=1 Tax=Microdochium trichocladiopsis TaxID=1682393 RepID=A0A9P8Y4I0_9PEZI|nr:acyl-CoA N-acyltransferase [Microdochium trichocladiopsis]KAH7029224.1 acyl-CoA N-acyltransferase [Microdochium trichocladiopsis]
MAVPKRKQLHDEKPSTENQSTRRATRQHPTTADDEPPKQLRSGRTRAGASEKSSDSRTSKRKSDTYVAEPRPASRDGPRRTTAIPPPSIPSSPEETARTRRTVAAPPPPQQQPQSKSTRQTRREPNAGPTSPSQPRAHPVPVETPISPPKHPLQLQREQVRLASSALPPGQPQHAVEPPNPKTSQQSRILPGQTSPEKTLASSVAKPRSAVKTTPKRQSRPLKPPSTPGPDRNIDKVFLGNICFRAWYPSYYPKEVLADSAGNAGPEKDGQPTRQVGKVGGGKHAAPQPILERLLVCPCCFKYSRELATWWEHIRYCERKAHVPGRKVYTHPRTGVRQPRTHQAGGSDTATADTGKARRKGHVHEEAKPDPSAVSLDSEGEWSVWEVDGEKDGLFCQNLSLFAKLFLDNKSVFFDVTGFNYFLLVYTPKLALDGSRKEYPDPALGEGAPPAIARPQIVGFFSKEKVSWDNNNLACILVFPPWQRKGLGSLLMGVSYAISRREGVLGGPEKPISELGRKGYNRFWAGEIARWLLSLPASAPRAEKRRAAKDDKADHEVLVDIADCSEATWIVPEDCLQILRDMGLVEEAGLGPAKRSQNGTASSSDDPKHHGTADHSNHASSKSAATGSSHGGTGGEGEDVVKLVPRVRLDKAAVQKWVETHRISLERTCDPDGFIPGYAIRNLDDFE